MSDARQRATARGRRTRTKAGRKVGQGARRVLGARGATYPARTPSVRCRASARAPAPARASSRRLSAAVIKTADHGARKRAPLARRRPFCPRGCSRRSTLRISIYFSILEMRIIVYKSWLSEIECETKHVVVLGLRVVMPLPPHSTIYYSIKIIFSIFNCESFEN